MKSKNEIDEPVTQLTIKTIIIKLFNTLAPWLVMVAIFGCGLVLGLFGLNRMQGALFVATDRIGWEDIVDSEEYDKDTLKYIAQGLQLLDGQWKWSEPKVCIWYDYYEHNNSLGHYRPAYNVVYIPMDADVLTVWHELVHATGERDEHKTQLKALALMEAYQTCSWVNKWEYYTWSYMYKYGTDDLSHHYGNNPYTDWAQEIVKKYKRKVAYALCS